MYGASSFTPPPPNYVAVPIQRPAQGSRKGLVTGLVAGMAVLLIGLCVFSLFWSQADSRARVSATATAYTMYSDATSTSYALSSEATSTALAIRRSATATSYQATYTARLTPTPYPPYSESVPPSGRTFSGYAQSVLTNAQLASEIRQSDHQPTKLASVFVINQLIYVSMYVPRGVNGGYILPIWYMNGGKGYEGTKVTQQAGYYGYAYTSASYSGTGNGAVEVYWCTKSDCSDKQLAWVRPFKVVRG
jgi:hypothetical protein